ncbi:N-acyl homoserine lactonase family protein [Paracraurococcus lichenis]|uniref:N-acyl homoserine lactonase family protein n=1 Tax=Paracraurococcus lichenis TaxID=3064888 RepID=A0ABT9DZ29_9PROT|nr:N-acyl homoserine lactonase family protein [Paracraurococcus sp. LOR1-02]MDO9709005.1 N-acyl homoserine lactonase family protein [Paracraurococcus sp. LOR1-02]
MSANWEVYAIRYGRHDRPAQSNFLLPVQDPHEAMPLDYFVWLVRDKATGHDIVVDTGFDHACAEKRGRTISRSVADSLLAMDCDPAKVRDVVVTHLHYDHAGSIEIFSGAKIHIQDREMAFATGRHMCTACIRIPFEADHVVAMVRALFADKVQFHDGEGQIAPGVTVHRVGGHSDGLQVVRVETARGPVVLASDAMHFYANSLTGNPFPIIFDLGAMTQGWRIAKKLAGGDETRVIPGHDPAVRERFPKVPGQGEDVVALHLPPVA